MTENITDLNSNQKYFFRYNKIYNFIFSELFSSCKNAPIFPHLRSILLLKVSLKRWDISLESMVSKGKNKSVNKYYTQFVLPETKQELTVVAFCTYEQISSIKTNYYLEITLNNKAI